MKNLLFFLIVLAGVGLFFHDKQQTADLDKAQSDNAALNQQLTTLNQQLLTTQAELNGLRLKLQQTPAFQPSPSALSQPPHSSNAPTQGNNTDPESLNRPAYH